MYVVWQIFPQQPHPSLPDSLTPRMYHSYPTSTKQLLAVNDCWPEATKLSKGEHFVRVQVRHPDQSALKRLKAHPLTLVRKLSNSLAVPVHGSILGVSTAAKPPPSLCLDK